jgi:hypothetical protein
MIHGRNAGPANILDLVPLLARPNLAYLAPAAAGPHLVSQQLSGGDRSNEPGLSSALDVLTSLVARVEAAGIARIRALSSWVFRKARVSRPSSPHATRAVSAGSDFQRGSDRSAGTPRDYPGRFDGTPVFLRMQRHRQPCARDARARERGRLRPHGRAE